MVQAAELKPILIARDKKDRENDAIYEMRGPDLALHHLRNQPSGVLKSACDHMEGPSVDTLWERY